MIRSLFSQLSSIVMALLFAAIIWAVATSEQNPSREGVYPDALTVETVNLPDGLIVYQKTAETVRLTIRAPQASWDQLRPSSFHVVADLKALDAGLHPVPVRWQVADPRVNVISAEPSTIGIRLERIKSREIEVHSNVLDSAPLGYAAKSPVVNPARVTLSGPGLLVDRVTEVAADVYLRGAKASVTREVPVLARDVQGQTVSGVTITPATVVVNVPVEQRVGYRDVSIKAVLKGTVASGYWVSNIIVTPSTATLVGSAEGLARISGFIETLPIDVSGATADLNKPAILALPEGVSILSSERITVQVSVTPILGGQTIRRNVVLLGARRGLSATSSPDSVEVILSGPLPSLQALTPEDVQVVIDLDGLTPGVHPLKPSVRALPPMLKVQSIVPDTIRVNLTEPRPASTLTLTPTLTITPTLTLTATLTITPTPTR